MQAAPVVLAAVGSYFGPIGTSIGWMVGSWLYNAYGQKKNNTLDPIANEAPVPNQALRGTVVPVLFGTNRVSSQIVWTNGFQAIRNDKSSGSKLGGSGGGKSAKGSQTSGSFTYKWDIIYHLGMVPVPVNLYGGWLGADKLNNQTVAQIAGLFGGSGPPMVIPSVPPPQTQTPSTISPQNGPTPAVTVANIAFDSAVFLPGSNPATTSWSYFNGVIGLNGNETIVFPSTTWVGFKALVLGSSPNVPQLSWEVGPAAAKVTINAATIGEAKGSDGLGTFDRGVWGTANKTAAGNIIRIAGVSPDNNNGGFRAYKVSDGSIAWSYSQTSIKADVVTAFPGDATAINAGTVKSFGTVDPACKYYLCAANNGNTFWWTLYDVSGNSAVFKSSIKYTKGVADTTQYLGTNGFVDLAGQKTNSDPIILGHTGISAHNTPWHVVQLPSINYFLASNGTWEIGAGGGLSGSDNWPAWVDPLNGSYFGTGWGLQAQSGNNTYVGYGWAVPKSATPPTGLMNTAIHFYVNKGMIGDNQSYINSIRAANPNGAIVELDLGVALLDPPHLSGIASIGPTINVINASLVDAQGVGVFPFSDEGVDRYDSGASTSFYGTKPTCQLITGANVAAGGYITIFTMVADGLANQAPNPPGNWVTSRVFVWNPVTFQYIQELYGSGACVDQSHLAGLPVSGILSFQDATVWADIAGNQLYFAGIQQGGTNDTWVIQGQFGSFSIGGQADVPPPYIIYQILTNPVFGLGISTSRIDLPSYNAANQYCIANGWLVSTQYRRTENFNSIVELLLAIYGGYLTIINGTISFGIIQPSTTDPSVRTLDNSHFVVLKPGDDPVQITRGAPQDTFNKIKVNFIDRLLYYKQNMAHDDDEVDQDLNGIRVKEFPLQFVMSFATAQAMATRALWTNLYARDQYQFYLGWKDADLAPGCVVTLVDSFSNLQQVRARITNWKEQQRGQFQITAQQEFDYFTSTSAFVPLSSVSSSSILNVTGPINQATYATAFELPQEFQGASPKVIVGYVPGIGAAGARLYVSGDNVSFQLADDESPYPLAGTILRDLGNDPRREFDEDVQLLLFPNSAWTANSPSYDIQGTLSDVSIDNMGFNAGLMWVGSEMVAYEGLSLLGQNWYKAKRIYRAWGGTNLQKHSSGDFFVKMGAGLFVQTYNENNIGTTLYYKVSPYNLAGQESNISSIPSQSYVIQGTYFRPQNAGDVSLVGSGGTNYGGQTKLFVTGTGDISVAWADSARQSGYGMGGFGTVAGGFGAFATDTLSHSWRVEVVGSGGVVVRSLSVAVTSYTYPSSQNVADNGAWRGKVAIKVTPFGVHGDALRTSVLSLELF